MSEIPVLYVLGLLTVPAVLAAAIVLWAAITQLGRFMVGFTSLVGPGSPGFRRDSMGALIATATRAVMVRFGGSYAIVFVKGKRIDNEAYRIARDALAEHGPYKPKTIVFNENWAAEKRTGQSGESDA